MQKDASRLQKVTYSLIMGHECVENGRGILHRFRDGLSIIRGLENAVALYNFV